MSRHLIPAQRRDRIREYIEIHRIVRSADLCDMLEVSEATVRRDLEWLEEQGVLERTHGGAILSQRVPSEPQYAHRAQIRAEEKRKIGAAAASLVEDGDVVFANSGTTITQVITHLPAKSELQVITNNVRAVLEAGDCGFELRLLGGTFYPRASSVVGQYATDMLRRTYASKTFVGVEGVSPRYGCTVPDQREARIVQLMIERTRGPVILVADHSKWGAVSNFEVASINRVHKLITDSGLDPDARAELSSHSVEVVIVGEDPGAT
ncbi:MAG: DeoR/GlpR family DNA-binding transcription regulator [Anaerolineae bacterium]